MACIKPKKCPYCQKRFQPDRRSGADQICCSAEECTRKRKRDTQKRWHAKNPHYWEGRYTRSTKPWLEAHPGYLKQYRNDHTDYTEHNRVRQKERYKKRHRQRLDKQDALMIQELSYQGHVQRKGNLDIQDALTPYPELFSGLMSQLRDLDIQDTIDISLAAVYNRGRFLKRLCERTSHAETRCSGQTDP